MVGEVDDANIVCEAEGRHREQGTHPRPHFGHDGVGVKGRVQHAN